MAPNRISVAWKFFNLVEVMMDVVKTETEADPLAIQTSDNTDRKEKKPLSEEVNFFNLHLTQIKKEYVDHSYDLTPEMTLDDTQVPVNFTFVKCEAEEESCDLDTLKEDLKLEVTAEEDDILTERCRVVSTMLKPPT
ncbi:uncharacterized protein [Periplaneta americana]|uniref:uncharacterized protein isoform X5 n=1 Tax=Periplaneta americana TaxID=6978 RepID=UPI0037E8F1EE